MRLRARLDALARRVPETPPDREEAINRAVFARYDRGCAAALAAAPPIDLAAYEEEFEEATRECAVAGLVLSHSDYEG